MAAIEATGDWRQYVTSDTLQASDLVGKHHVVVIEKVTQAMMTDRQDAKKQKGVLNVYFKGKRKPLVVKAEMSSVIAKIAGSRKCKDWVGIAIEIYPTSVYAFGENHEVVRISPRAPSAASSKAASNVKPEADPPAHDMVPDEIREVASKAPTEEEQREIAERERKEAGR